MTTAPARAHASVNEATDNWTQAMRRILAWASNAGPLLMVGAALLVSFEVQMLTGDLDWISEPEGLIGMVAAPCLVATYIAIGRHLATAAPRTGVTVTVLGVVAATSFVNPMATRLLSVDLVEVGVDHTVVSEAWDAPTLWSALAVLLVFQLFLVAIIAGVTVLRTGVAPRWTGVALIAFVPVFIAAQAADAAIEITYPLAWLLFAAAVYGITHADPEASR